MSYLGEVLSDSPLAYWRLSETSGTQMVDASGYGRHGSYISMPAWGFAQTSAIRSDETDTGVHFSTGSYAEVPYSSWADLQNFTIEAWVSAQGEGALNGPLFSRDAQVEFDSPYSLVFHPTNGAIFYVRKNGVMYYVMTDQSVAATLSNGAWHYVVVTHSVSTGAAKIYVDGVEATYGASTPPPYGVLDTTSQPVRVAHSSDVDARYFAGKVDELAVYGSVLSEGRIAAHYEASKPEGVFIFGEAELVGASGSSSGTARVADHQYVNAVKADTPLAYWLLNETTGTLTDKSGHNRVITPAGSPTRGDPGPFKGHSSITLNGTSQHLASDVPINNSAWTIELWYKGTDTDGVIASSRSGGRSITMYLGQVPVTGSPAGSIGIGLSSDSIWQGAYTTTARVNDGKWHHIVGVFDAPPGTNIQPTHFKVYIDSVAVQTTASSYSTTTAPVNSNGVGYFFGGGSSDGPNRLSGSLSNVALYGYALSVGRVLTHYALSGTQVKASAPAQVAASALDGVARTEVIVRGTPFISYAQLTMPTSKMMLGQATSIGCTGSSGTARVKAPVLGTAWAVQSNDTSGGLPRFEIIIRGDSWQSAHGMSSGAPINEPDITDVIQDDVSYPGTGSAVVISDTPYPTDVYRYLTFDIMTDELLAEVQMNDVSFSTLLSQVGDLSGTVYAVESQPDVDLYWATMPMKTAIYVLRGNQAMWGGIIWNREYDTATKQVSISASTWESYLYRRYIWHTLVTREDEDQYEVVRQLLRKLRSDFFKEYTLDDHVTPMPMSAAVDVYPQGDVSAGKNQPTLTFPREDLKTFGEAIDEYANQEDGFEWYFLYSYNAGAQRFRRRLQFLPTPPALMKKGAPTLGNNEEDKPGIDTFVFEYPGNILTVSLSEDADNAATRQFVVGGPPEGIVLEGFKPISSWNNTTYLDKGFPLVENVESSKHANVSKFKSLKRLAKVYGQQSSPPLRKWSITVNGSMFPIVGTYRLGHWCRVIINDRFVQQSLSLAGENQIANGIAKRIIGITVNVPAGPQLPETVTLELEDDVVTTWEDADKTDEEGTSYPTPPVSIYPSGQLDGVSVGAAGAPQIKGAVSQWSDSDINSWGQLTTWQDNDSESTTSNKIKAKFDKRNLDVSGKTTAIVKLQLQSQGQRAPLPKSIKLQNSANGSTCFEVNPTGTAGVGYQAHQWTMTSTGGVSSLGSWLADGKLEVVIEGGEKPGPSNSAEPKTYKLRIFEVRVVIG